MTKSPIQSIDRAFSILKLLTTTPHGLKAAEIAERLSLKTTTVHGLLRALLAWHAVEHDPVNYTYRLGPAIVEMARSRDDTFELRMKAEPLLIQLRDQTKETVNIGVLRNFRVFTLIELLPERSLSARELPLAGSPPHLEARGKVLLAHLSEELLAQFAKSMPELEPLTPKSISSHEQLRKELVQVRQQGFGRNMEESSPGVCGLAVPVRDSQQKVAAAIGLAVPLIRWSPERQRELLQSMRQTAEELERLL